MTMLDTVPNQTDGAFALSLEEGTAEFTLALAPAWDGWQRRAKRAIDVTASAALLLLLLPLLCLIALAIRLETPGPLIFSQVRCGKNGRRFTFYKFRGMVADAEQRKQELMDLNEAGGLLFKIREDPRVTRVGRLIRRTSLDELPQLWNVLIGDMSLVGPRPPVPSEYEQYQPWQRQRLAAIPGISGLWQVSGRSMLDFDQMVELDMRYARQWSLWLDLTILLRTFRAVLSRHGAY